MNYANLIKFFPYVLHAKLFKRKKPLAVSWALTYKCNSRCEYCRLSSLKKEELDTSEVLSLLDQLNLAGTRFVSFTGGEPLLREDIDEIIERAVLLGIKISVNSNGKLVSDKIGAIKKISLLRISLDGPKPINDSIRGPGSFDKAINAIETAKGIGINVEINTVISKINAGYISEVINLAEKMGVKVSFQPATHFIFRQKLPNPISPSMEEYRAAINFLIDNKKQGCDIIANTFPGLKYLYNWPQTKEIQCSAGLLSCRIEPDGTLFACGWIPILDEKDGINLRKISFARAFHLAKAPDCSGCWCDACVEFNLLTSFNPIVFLKILKEKLL
jgi:MoaA/NifB/PqqE/SkfB family radical SAM enzyme